MQSCRASSKAAWAQTGEALPPAPAVRGVKPCEAPVPAAEAMRCPVARSSQDAARAEEARRWGPLSWRVLGKVPGNYVRASVENPEAHATALVLGRAFAMCAVHNIPDTTCQKMLAQLHLAGVDLGQKHHSRDAISAYIGVLARLSMSSKSEGFWTPPRNLQFPSAWRLVFDGVTLPHGVTVTVVLVVFTSFSGEIETAFLGCTRTATIKEVLSSCRRGKPGAKVLADFPWTPWVPLLRCRAIRKWRKATFCAASRAIELTVVTLAPKLTRSWVKTLEFGGCSAASAVWGWRTPSIVMILVGK